jgi:hypothetical protein
MGRFRAARRRANARGLDVHAGQLAMMLGIHALMSSSTTSIVSSSASQADRR